MNHTIVSLSAAALLAAVLPAQSPDHEFHARDVFGRMNWVELGPTAFGGRILDIEVHPANQSVIWVAAASGGLFKSTNGGVTFAPQFQDAYSLSIGDLAVAPSNGDVLYVGTGEANNQRSSYWGNGVWKSTDGGTTWKHAGLDGTDHIGRVVVHPTNPDIVWVAAAGALYTPNAQRGMYRTMDGGTTWEHVKQLGPDTGFIDVAVDPKNPDVLYGASYERRRRAWDFSEGGAGSRLWKSVDGGRTWDQLGGGLPGGDLGRIGLAVFPADPKVVYAAIENINPAPQVAAEKPAEQPAEGGKDAEPSAEELADPVAVLIAQTRADQAQDAPRQQPRRKTVGGEVWRSDDAGATWRKVNGTRAIGGDPGYYYGQVRVDPKNADIVYVLSVQLYRTEDGGKTWTPGEGRGARGRNFANSLHVDHHALWIDPRDGNHALLGNDGGLAVTWDGGNHWDHNDRLPIAQFYAIAVDNRDPYRIYGGTQDNGTWGFPLRGRTSAGIRVEDAYRINGGDGFHVCVDPENPDVVYSESQFGGLGRLDLRTGESASIRPRAPKGSPALRFNWMTPLALSAHNPKTLYTGSQYVHRSRNRGTEWTVISPDLTTSSAERLKGDVPHCTITTIAESPKAAGMLWVGTDDGRVWLTKDDGGRWTELTDRFPAEVQGLWVSRVESSPHDDKVAFVAFTGYRDDLRRPFVFRTDDGGETFRAIGTSLPQEPVNVVRQHPRNPKVLLVGTEMGAYVSVDEGAHFHRLGNNLPRVAVHDLLVHPREPHVLVGTHGRGIWAMDASALEGLDADKLSQPLVALPPSNGVILPRPLGRGNVGAREWIAPNPFTTATFRYFLEQDVDGKVEIEVLDATGTVLWRKDGPTKAGYHEVPWSSEGQGARGGLSGFSRGGRQSQGQRGGSFAVRIRHGENSATMPFMVNDLRGPRSAIGGVPGVGTGTLDEETTVEESGEESGGR